MIIKPRLFPVYIQKLEAFTRRLSPDHPKFELIKENLSKRLAGFRGEESLDYHLKFLDEQQYNIFHDVRLFDGIHYFQLDTVILSKKFILILEVKNFVGTLHFDSNFSQLIRLQDGKKESFPDPILQVERQSDQLRRWLKHVKCAKLPVESLVVISNPRTILETTHHNEKIYKKVIHSAKLPFSISSIEKDYDKNYLSEKQLLRLSQQMVKDHSPLKSDILARYNIQKEDIKKGVFCRNCESPGMERRKGKWICQTCRFVSKDAHLTALKDYSLLIDSTITNQILRDFLNIQSTSVANKLLFSMALESKGTNKGKIHHLNFE
ncbi:nuclease-related domain-containing protein [Metabacillus bambusae]|uniref:NERD domain-containing protein n=1 Tax=Metabacillus bambusae TaxID=2795218 RepID=A0ABS3N5X0_9BACI|nr:nuclease-related domain-containing protein [Metabacillus bambusae]MBO1513619.1 NERD domain-containing protein [Metabacillus bambusae]